MSKTEKRNIRKRDMITEAVLIFFAAALSMPAFELFPLNFDPAHVPVDFPYHWFQNHAWVENHKLFENTHFPHGSFGILQYLWPITDYFQLGLALILLQRMFLAFLIFRLLESIRLKWVVFAVSLICIWPLRFADGLVLQAVLLFILFTHTPNKRWSYMLLVTAVFSYYLRLFPFVMSTCLFVASVGLYYLRSGKKVMFWALPALPVLVAAIWGVVYQNLDSFLVHNKAILELFKGSGPATALYPQNNLLLLFLSFALLAFVFYKTLNLTQGIVLIGAWFLLFKYAFVREGYAHVQVYPEIMMATGLILAIRHKKFLVGNLSLLLVSILCFLWNMQITTGRFWPALDNFFAVLEWPYFLSTDRAEAKFREETRAIKKYYEWPEAAQRIEGATTTVFPYNYLYPILNEVNFEPTPITQSYVAYTPWLDSLQSAFFRGSTAPEYIFMHGGFGSHQYLSIDYQYFQNVAPRTQRAIHNNYHRILSREDVSLWQRKPDRTEIGRMDMKQSLPLNEWINVSDYGGVEIYCKPNIELNLLGRIRGFLYKPPRVIVVYELHNGELYRFDLNMANQSGGIMVQPFYLDRDRENMKEVRRVKIISDQEHLFKMDQ